MHAGGGERCACLLGNVDMLERDALERARQGRRRQDVLVTACARKREGGDRRRRDTHARVEAASTHAFDETRDQPLPPPEEAQAGRNLAYL